jgi:hypothetical protein
MSASEPIPPTTPIGYRLGIMPRPGQPGALHFDNTNITEFLRRWNNELQRARTL